MFKGEEFCNWMKTGEEMEKKSQIKCKVKEKGGNGPERNNISYKL